MTAAAIQPVSAAQLDSLLHDWHGQSDGDMASHIAELQLTERVPLAQLAPRLAALPGPKSQRALTAIVDEAAFLKPSANEIPALPDPSLEQQRTMMGLTADYVARAIRQLPHFYAARALTHYESATASEASPADFGALHAVRLSRATVQYNDGEEIVQAAMVKAGKHADSDEGLHTWGVFGPIVSLVLLDAAQNQLAWSHWEQGASGPLAVFRYSVPQAKSHYEVRYCCVVDTYGFESKLFRQMSGYHGEIGIDPKTGAILRLVLHADLQPGEPISRADLLVHYAPVKLGGMSYICPVHSISISVAQTLRRVEDATGRTYPAMGPPHKLLNDSEFDHYHLFHTETHMLSGNEERASGMAPDATLPTAASDDAQPSEEILADAPAATGAPGSPAAQAEAPEISSSAATALPETAAHPAPPPAAEQPSGFTLHINARLVDVNVVALDKKGRPISNLKPEDFEIYDNGVKQTIHSFSQADSGSAPTEPNTAPAPATPQTFSNRTDNQASTADTAAPGGNTFVLVIDPANLTYNDLVDARRQMINFVKKLPDGERVALYATRYHAYQVLEEATTDHARVAARLAKWTPSAQDLLNARDQEDRNRQTMETVHSPEDLLSVNGGFTLDSQSQQVALDPKLRELGSNSGPNALWVLTDIAGHLAPMAGHKSVVWVTSDNALADWNRMSETVEKHSKYIEPAALRIQEAMNNAHASIYPLDASRLEANVINAEIGNRNVQLTPTYQMPPAMEKEQEGTEVSSGIDINQFGQNRDLRPGRLTSQMQQDMRPIEGVFREIAEATGGHAFRRSSNIVGELNGVETESHATYLLGFTPAQPADGQYHVLTVKLVAHRDATVRYRTGYQYNKEPTSLKDRFTQAVWQSGDSREIGISAQPVTDAVGKALRVTVAGTDLDLTQQNLAAGKIEIWSGKLDIFLVERDRAGERAHVTGQTVGLHLKPATYQHAVNDGLTFDQRVQLRPKADLGSLRVVVVDVNSGRIGSVTVPAAALQAN
jgi:VWFA-related protein